VRRSSNYEVGHVGYLGFVSHRHRGDRHALTLLVAVTLVLAVLVGLALGFVGLRLL
jgi:hypothetical protein